MSPLESSIKLNTQLPVSSQKAQTRKLKPKRRTVLNRLLNTETTKQKTRPGGLLQSSGHVESPSTPGWMLEAPAALVKLRVLGTAGSPPNKGHREVALADPP